mgnify:CR=1 FL=1
MANIKKSFNFRNGVQVDDDNLLVTSTGLVAIGKTIPTEALDVIGNVVVSGVTSSVEANIGLLTATTFNPTEIIGAGVSISSGIITNPSMDATGIVTYYGDGQYLQNLPTSQLTTVGGGNTNIFIIPSVGIGTTNPQFNFQVGNDVNSGASGVGISSDGNIKASGIVSATTFVGNLTGDTSGIHNGAVNLGTNESLKVGTAITVTDIGSHVNITKNKNIFHIQELTSGSNLESWGSVVDAGGTLVIVPQFRLHRNGPVELYHQNGSKKFSTSGVGVTVFGELDTTNIKVSSAATFASDVDIDGHTNLDNISVAGVTTFSDDVFTGVGATVGIGTTVFFGDDVQANFGDQSDLKIYHTSNTSFVDANADGSGNLILFGDTISLGKNVGSLGLRFVHGAKTQLMHAGIKKFETESFGATISGELQADDIVASGVITATTELNSPLIGVGTNVPANDIQVRKNGNVEIQVTSDTGSAGLTVGRESGTSNTNNAEFRYGLVSGGAPYSSAQSLDILNYGTGNFNYNISANNASAIAGDFHWHKGVNNTIMTLTGIGGSLGIGITTPSEELHVIGGAIITGNLTANNLNGNLNGTLTGNANVTSGVSTFKNLKVTGITTIGSGNDTVFVNDLGVGIKTTTNLTNVTINASQANASINAVAIGATVLKSAVDFADAGDIGKRFMIPPKVGAAQTASLTGLVSGAMIYNTNLNKLQVYNGTNWETITSVEVTG